MILTAATQQLFQLLNGKSFEAVDNDVPTILPDAMLL
jgi:hypothetical protein